jgi:hypothetical protein
MSTFSDDWNWNEARPGIISGPRVEFMSDRIKWYPNDNKQLYSVNQHHYRSKDFEKNADILFSGCSMTYGEGVVESAIWGNIIADKLNMKAFNLGSPGGSVQFIINNLFNYFKEFGNPKNLFCIFPDFLRMEMYSQSSHMFDGKDKTDGKKNYHLLLNERDEYAKISKQPHNAREIIPKELPFAISLQYIKILEMYCQEAGVNFLWGTWVEEQEDYIVNKKIKFNNFIDLKNNLWHQEAKDLRKALIHKTKSEKIGCKSKKEPCRDLEICHENEKEKYGKNFDLAFDTDISHLNNNYGHYGAHVHIHWAEEFLKQMNV